MEFPRGRRPLTIVAGMKKTNDLAEPTQSNAYLIYEKIKIKLNDKHHFGFSQLHKYARNKPSGSTCGQFNACVCLCVCVRPL